MLPTLLPNTNEDALIGNIPLQEPNPDRGLRLLGSMGYAPSSDIVATYMAICESSKQREKRQAEFTARLILQTLDIVKIAEVGVYYIKNRDYPLYLRCPSEETLNAAVSYIYQLLFGFAADMKNATGYLLAGITHHNIIPNIERRYIGIAEQYVWDKQTATIEHLSDLPPRARVFAKMFDTDYEDDEIFKVPPFTSDQIQLMTSTYYQLRDAPYDKWPKEYHWQCFKDWSENRPDIEFGMFTVLALPFMNHLPRGAFFNSGEGHNGKSVLIGLAASILGKNNTSFVSGNSLSSWDNVVDLQTTFFNCPSETNVDFLKNDTDTFKALSAHETISSRVKHKSGSVPIVGDFPMVFNINKLPDFGSDASAILSRMFVNDFDCDFEATGKAIKNYARKTFLTDPNTIPTLVGMIFAFCYYYNSEEHPWEPRPAMVSRRESIREVATPHTRYLYWFSKFFDGFTKISTLRNDYIQFGRAEGEEYDTSMIKLKELPFKKYKRRVSSDGKTLYQENNNILAYKRFTMDDETYLRKYMGEYNLKELNHNIGESIVYKLMVEYQRREAEYKDLLKRAKLKKTDREIEIKLIQEMMHEIEKSQGSYKRFKKKGAGWT